MSKHTVYLAADGQGVIPLEVSAGTTLKDLADAENLNGYTVTIDSDVIPPMNWGSYVLDEVTQIWATKGVKGA